jgi:hypothetical protein
VWNQVLTLVTAPSGPIYPNQQLLPRPTLTLENVYNDMTGYTVTATAVGPGSLLGVTSVTTINHTISTTSGTKIIALFANLSFNAPGTYTLTFAENVFQLTASITVTVAGGCSCVRARKTVSESAHVQRWPAASAPLLN